MKRTEYVYAVETFFPLGADHGVHVGQQFTTDHPLVRRFPSQFRAFNPPPVAEAGWTPPNLESR